MTKDMLIDSIKEKAALVGLEPGGAALTKKDAGKSLDAVTAAIHEALQNGQDVKVPGLGTFKVKAVAARKGRNPATGETVDIPAKTKVVFKAQAGIL